MYTSCLFYYTFVVNRKPLTVAALFFLGFLALVIPTNARAATLYIDGNLSANCTGTYSIAARNCTGSDGDAYKIAGDGLAAATGGDTVGGTIGRVAASPPSPCGPHCGKENCGAALSR